MIYSDEYKKDFSFFPILGCYNPSFPLFLDQKLEIFYPANLVVITFKFGHWIIQVFLTVKSNKLHLFSQIS
jgi:hypothetical protein